MNHRLSRELLYVQVLNIVSLQKKDYFINVNGGSINVTSRGGTGGNGGSSGSGGFGGSGGSGSPSGNSGSSGNSGGSGKSGYSGNAGQISKYLVTAE